MKYIPGDEKLVVTLGDIWGVLDETWLYDLLPGNGDDDYILDRLRRRFMEVAKKPLDFQEK